MSRHKLRVKNTPIDNLVSNLRGEVGEVITTWVILRRLIHQERELSSGDISGDMRNQNLMFVSILTHKLTHEVIARLSELAENKVGRLNFHFAVIKLGALEKEVLSFTTFIQRHKFDEMRNYDISHKELPEQWSQHRHRYIPPKTIIHGIGMAQRIMKKIDRIVLGPAAKYLWHEMRKKRYSLFNPPRVMYSIMPYLRLSNEVRAKIVMEEMEEGRTVWSEMNTVISGHNATIYACKEWAVLFLGDRLMALDHYPLVDLAKIEFNPPPSDSIERSQSVEDTPIALVQKQFNINTKYKVIQIVEGNASFAPCQRLHLIERRAVTQLPNITINVFAKAGPDMASLKVGDVRHFSLTVTVAVPQEITP